MVTVTIKSAVAGDPGQGIDKTQSALIVEGSLALSGNYGSVSPLSGDAMSLVSPLVTANRPPRRVEIFQEPTAGTAPIHYSFLYARGTTQANGELVVIDTTTGLEISEGGPYPAALTSNTANIRFRATIPLFI